MKVKHAVADEAEKRSWGSSESWEDHGDPLKYLIAGLEQWWLIVVNEISGNAGLEHLEYYSIQLGMS